MEGSQERTTINLVERWEEKLLIPQRECLSSAKTCARSEQDESELADATSIQTAVNKKNKKNLERSHQDEKDEKVAFVDRFEEVFEVDRFSRKEIKRQQNLDSTGSETVDSSDTHRKEFSTGKRGHSVQENVSNTNLQIVQNVVASTLQQTSGERVRAAILSSTIHKPLGKHEKICVGLSEVTNIPVKTDATELSHESIDKPKQTSKQKLTENCATTSSLFQETESGASSVNKEESKPLFIGPQQTCKATHNSMTITDTKSEKIFSPQNSDLPHLKHFSASQDSGNRVTAEVELGTPHLSSSDVGSDSYPPIQLTTESILSQVLQTERKERERPEGMVELTTQEASAKTSRDLRQHTVLVNSKGHQMQLKDMESSKISPINPVVCSSKIEVERKFEITGLCENKLTDLKATLLSENSFTDIYFDDSDYKLTLSDCWLRQRDHQWELKIPISVETKPSLCTQYQEISENEHIQNILTTLLGKPVPGSGLHHKFKLTEFARYVTTRKTYALPECTVVFDKTNFGFNVGEIEVQVTSDAEIPDALDTIDRVAQKLGE